MDAAWYGSVYALLWGLTLLDVSVKTTHGEYRGGSTPQPVVGLLGIPLRGRLEPARLCEVLL
jgi:hypothetical protein